MKNYSIHLIRHGSTSDDGKVRYIGSTDLSLSDTGCAELESLMLEKNYPGCQIVYSSPLKRCLETAEIIYPNLLVQQINGLKEYDFGAFENKTIEELKETKEFSDWVKNGMVSDPPGAEDKELFKQRIEMAVENIVQDMMNKNITSAAVITHGGVIMEILSKFGLPQRNPLEWTTDCGCGYTITTSSYLWGNGRYFEIMDRLPIDMDENFQYGDFSVFDVE